MNPEQIKAGHTYATSTGYEWTVLKIDLPKVVLHSSIMGVAADLLDRFASDCIRDITSAPESYQGVSITPEQLEAVLEDHKLWLAGKGGRKADLRNAILSGLVLRNLNLRGADLRGINLSGSTIVDSDLSGSAISYAKLRGSTIIDSDLRWVDLSGSDLSESDLSGSDLSEATLYWTNLRGTELKGTKLHGTKLSGVRLGIIEDSRK